MPAARWRGALPGAQPVRVLHAGPPRRRGEADVAGARKANGLLRPEEGRGRPRANAGPSRPSRSTRTSCRLDGRGTRWREGGDQGGRELPRRRVRRSNGVASDIYSRRSHGFSSTTPRPSNLTNAEIYSLQSSRKRRRRGGPVYIHRISTRWCGRSSNFGAAPMRRSCAAAEGAEHAEAVELRRRSSGGAAAGNPAAVGVGAQAEVSVSNAGGSGGALPAPPNPCVFSTRGRRAGRAKPMLRAREGLMGC
ncbi:uncharacterized protein A4U43_C08F28950 [Asparagus officinalis]|nr:uncharacterized protein A4U43_C08F28950 [Asparagus officinalis]